MSIACDRMDHYDVIMANGPVKQSMKHPLKQPSDAVVDVWIALIRAAQVSLVQQGPDFAAASLAADRYLFLAKIACTRFFCSGVTFVTMVCAFLSVLSGSRYSMMRSVRSPSAISCGLCSVSLIAACR